MTTYALKHMLKSTISAFLIALLLVSTIPYVLLLCCWILISRALPEVWFHKVEDGLWGWYQRMVVFIFEHFTGVEVYISGVIPKVKENVLVISNHQCMTDWIVADFIALRQNMVGNMRYVFKNSLKYYPIYGFSFGVHGGIFVKRDGKYNDNNTKEVLDALVRKKTDIYFLIYPEGTRFSPHRKSLLEKSQSFALTAGLEPLEQVLTPRVKAFDATLNNLKDYIQAVYDVTIIYDVAQPMVDGSRPRLPNAWQFLTGHCKRVYIRFERIPCDEVMRDIASCNGTNGEKTSSSMKWLHRRFELKDNMIQKFYYGSKDESSTSAGTDIRNGKRSVLPLSSTLPSFVSFLVIHALALYFPLSRTIYLATSSIGVLLMCAYAHVFF